RKVAGFIVPAPTSRSYPCISAQPRSAQYVCSARRSPWKSLGALGIGRRNVDAARRLRKRSSAGMSQVSGEPLPHRKVRLCGYCLRLHRPETALALLSKLVHSHRGGPMTADLRQAKAALLRLRFPSLVQLRAHLHVEDNATLLFFPDPALDLVPASTALIEMVFD